MSENVEDLYLKGLMALSSKDKGSARTYWEQVLAIDPNHEKARKGLDELKAATSKKRSSKEVLQEIKRLYGAKKYEEALKLCDMLLKKHPKNKDLHGLRKKIESRCKPKEKAPEPPPEEDLDDTIGGHQQLSPGGNPQLESTVYYTSKAEEVVSNDTDTRDIDDPAAEVERLIQLGVSLYEVQDYEQAIKTWKEALAIDPDSRIARDYINNVMPELEEQNQYETLDPDAPIADSEPVPAATSMPEPEADPDASQDAGKPSKEELIHIYNEGMGLFKERRFEDALTKWNYILKFHPSHKETIQCIEKAKAAISREKQHHETLEEARNALAAGNHHDAERILTQLSIEAPHLEGIEQLKEAIEQRQRQITEIRTMEIEETEEQNTTDFSASDDEITRYFTPDSEGKKVQPRRVAKVVQARKERKPLNLKLLIGIPVTLLLLGIGGWFGYDFYRKLPKPGTETMAVLPLIQEVNWNGSQQKAEDFHGLGSDFMDESNYLMANFAFQRVTEIAVPRIQELETPKPDSDPVAGQTELDKLRGMVAEARTSRQTCLGKVAPVETGDRDFDLAMTEFRKGMWTEAEERLTNMLSSDLEDERVREELGKILEQLAFKKLAEEELDESLKYFQRAAVLQKSYEMPRRHMAVIQRFFHGTISREEKDQWFFFFRD